MKWIIIVSSLFLLSACTNQAEKNEISSFQSEEDILTKDLNKELPKGYKSKNDNLSTYTYDAKNAIWGYEYDSEINDFKLTKLRSINSDTLNPVSIVKLINENWPKVQLKLEAISNDTIFINIPNSEVLTQQMGTSGADNYMITTTFSLTELNDINYVSFDFEAGDHCSPGIYHRDSWELNRKP